MVLDFPNDGPGKRYAVKIRDDNMLEKDLYPLMSFVDQLFGHGF